MRSEAEKDYVVVISCFIRSDTLKSLIISMQESHISHVYFVVDGPRNDSDLIAINGVLEVIELYASKFQKSVIRSNKNQGPFENIRTALAFVFQHHDRALYLEDDIVISSDLFSFLNQLLQLDNFKSFKIINCFLPFDLETHKDSFLSKSLTTSSHMINKSTYLELERLVNISKDKSFNQYIQWLYNNDYLKNFNTKWILRELKSYFKKPFYSYELFILIILSKSENYSIFPSNNLVYINSQSIIADSNFNSPQDSRLIPNSIRKVHLRDIEKYDSTSLESSDFKYHKEYDVKWSTLKGEINRWRYFLIKIETLYLYIRYGRLRHLIKKIKGKYDSK